MDYFLKSGWGTFPIISKNRIEDYFQLFLKSDCFQLFPKIEQLIISCDFQNHNGKLKSIYFQLFPRIKQ